MVVLNLGVYAQETLMPLNGNAQLQNIKETPTLLAYKTSTIVAMDTLPFFDDFSYSTTSTRPTNRHWLDSSVFINYSFPIAPPSIGVATFDGLNKKGYPYNISALVSNSSPADKLTSRPINIKKKGNIVYQPSDSVYLSFYYQAEGRGDNPEANDSLCVDFYKAKQNKWVKVWGKKGYNPSSNDTLFHIVMIKLDSLAYFDSLFQFRFRNNATLSGSLDHWHVDYIYLNKNRSRIDTVMEDDAFQYMSTPFLKNYAVMPYRQFIQSEMAPQVHNYIRNNFTSTKNTSYNYTVSDTLLNTQLTFYNGGNDNIVPYAQSGIHTAPQHARPSVTFSFPAPLTDTAIYKIKHVISTNPDLVRENDTLIQIQKFANYYAYDDGTAEVGYYNNTYGAKNAVRYTINNADTLRAMRIYFDPITDGQASIGSTFRMGIWANGSNGPGNIIYRDSTINPVYLQGRNNLMPTYKLTSCLILNPGTYYFGIQQTTNKPLNLGFDKNNNHSDALYYDIGNGWVQSAIKGSLMINPVMGCTIPPPPVGIKPNDFISHTITLFPNPAQNTIIIQTNDLKSYDASVAILSSIGQEVYTSAFHNNEPIDISNLSNGVYFVSLNGSSLNVIPKKLIIAR